MRESEREKEREIVSNVESKGERGSEKVMGLLNKRQGEGER